MKNQRDNRFPKAASVYLALLLIVIVVLAGYEGSQAVAAADSAPVTTSTEELIWVREDDPVINVNDDPTYYENTEPRFAGTFDRYTVNETEITWETRYVDHGNEGYHLTYKTVIDRPPIVLNPPLRYKIRATASHSGTHNWGGGGIGLQFWYSSPYAAVIEPKEVLGYYPFHGLWDGTSYKEWMINPPAIGREGDEFEITAGWWNCAPCNVTWTYKAEPANAIPRLGVEVLEPSVIYQGEEVLPGETYYPETCPGSTTNTADSCSNTHVMKDGSKVSLQCLYEQERRLLLVLDSIELKSKGDEAILKAAILQIAAIKLAEKCKYAGDAGSEYRLDLAPEEEAGDEYLLDLVLEKGAIQLSNKAGDQTIGVDTPLGAAYTTSKGAFLTAYNPDTKSALFRAYSTPLLLEPKSGSTMVLKPLHEVELTSKGFGPVKELPHVYLPMVK